MEGSRRPTKNEKRRLKEKQTERGGAKSEAATTTLNSLPAFPGVEVEYVSAADLLQSDAEAQGLDSSTLEHLKNVFKKFARPEEMAASSSSASTTSLDNSASTFAEKSSGESGGDGGEVSEEGKALSRRRKKEESRMTVAELKQKVQRPDLVEAHDVASSDPVLLIELKSSRNSVPVPRHWSQKSKYLQRKRGIEKPPFKLPDHIADTGISKIRDSILEAEEKARAKSRARARVQPKMGKIDIDYQVLHDAFFKYQTKPRLTTHGDLYYEGKEFESGGRNFRPGFLSKNLREALGLPVEGNAVALTPPPWLTNMQRYGPPPSYPTLRIPGLNAPIPRNAQFGYHPGGWGRPPVDEHGRPLYGDVFGALSGADGGLDEGEEIIDKVSRWGEVVAVVGEDESEEEGDEDGDEDGDGGADEEAVPVRSRYDEAALDSSLVGGNAGVASDELDPTDHDTGTAAAVDLRKRDVVVEPAGGPPGIAAAAAAGSEGAAAQPPQLFRVLSERAPASGPGADGSLFGSAKTYNVAGDQSVQTAAGSASTVAGGGTTTETGDKSKRKRAGEAELAAKKFKESFKF